MVSVIICSANADLLSYVKTNINNTIGVPFEILAYDNSNAERGICEIYNQGVRDARYNVLCFVHEDVVFNSFDWGAQVLMAFEENGRLGLLGIAGSSYKSLAPSGWQGSEIPAKINFMNLVQKYKHADKGEEIKYNNQFSSTVAQVAVIDGVWFCGQKDILTKHPFDQWLLPYFHGYDIDISLSVGSFYDIGVTFKVMLTHFSEGNFGADWVKATLRLHEKWKLKLPVNKASLTEAEMRICEKNAFRSFVSTMKKSGYSSYSCLKVLNRSGIKSRFGVSLYLRLAVKCLSA